MARKLSLGILHVVALAVGSVPLTREPLAQASTTGDNTASISLIHPEAERRVTETGI